MEPVDIVLLVLLGFGAYRGYKSGLIMQLLGIIAFFLAIIGGFHLMYWGVDWLRGYFSDYEAILPIISFVGIFLIILIVINLVGKFLKSLLDMTLLGSFDNLGGAVTGLLKWALVLSLLIWVIETYGHYSLDHFYEKTVVLPFVAMLTPFLFDSLALILPHLEDFSGSMNPYEQASILIPEKSIFTRDFSRIVVL